MRQASASPPPISGCRAQQPTAHLCLKESPMFPRDTKVTTESPSVLTAMKSPNKFRVLSLLSLILSDRMQLQMILFLQIVGCAYADDDKMDLLRPG